MAGRAGRRRRQGGGGIGPRRPDGEGLVRWQGESRRGKASGATPWLLAALVAGVTVLATIAAQTAGWRAWTSLLMVASAAAFLATMAVWGVALVRRGLAWLAG